MNLMKILLLPIALLYGIIVTCRNWLYDLGIFPSTEFKTSVISIGNLSVGGTGKSPMTEYLIRLLKEKVTLATLSRGYKRHTTGFLVVENDSTSIQVGDEPLQFKKKFQDIVVAVDENRKNGIQKLLAQFPKLKIILLDDAFQHRRVKPGLSILLTEYTRMFYDDFLLPAGSLREWRAGKKRADIFVVTKCPNNLTPVEKRIIQKKIDNQKEENNKVNNNFNGFLGGTKIEFCVDCYLKEKRSKSENEFVNGLSHVERNKFYDLVKIKINKHHPKISDELIRLIK